MNGFDIALLALVAAAAALALRHLRRRKKSGCGGACSCCGADCPMKNQGLRPPTHPAEDARDG